MGHDLRSGSWRTRTAAALAATFSLPPARAPVIVRADSHLVAPSRTIDPATPFRLSLIVTGEARLEVRFAARVLLRVTLTPDVGAAARVELRRETPVPEQIELLRGESRRIDHGGAVPANLRGRVRTDSIDLDVPAMRVPISTHRSSAVAEPASLPAAVPDAARSPSRRLVPATTLIVRSGGDPNRHDACRLTVCEPMFALVGAGIDSNARFQLCSSCASANRPTRTRAVVVLPGAPRRLAHRRQFGRPRGRLRT